MEDLRCDDCRDYIGESKSPVTCEVYCHSCAKYRAENPEPMDAPEFIKEVMEILFGVDAHHDEEGKSEMRGFSYAEALETLKEQIEEMD